MRQRALQDRERNPFEDVGLESSWTIEFLPDQPFDLARISDVRVWFQYEARLDDNLRRLLETKRYAGRREMATLAVLALVRDRDGSADPRQALAFKTARDIFEGPALDKTIVNAGVALRLKDGKVPGGPTAIEVAFEGAPPVTVTTTSESENAACDSVTLTVAVSPAFTVTLSRLGS